MRCKGLAVAGLAGMLCLLGGQTVRAQDVTMAAVGRLRQGMDYAQARAILVGAGWQATLFPWHTAVERCGGRDDICKRYLETESCSGTGLGFCRFEYTNSSGKTFIVITAGMDLVVQNWRFE